MENAFVFEISWLADVVHAAENLRVFFAEQSLYFIFSPNEKLSFLAFAVGVLSGIKPAFGMQHFTQQVIDGFIRRPT